VGEDASAAEDRWTGSVRPVAEADLSELLVLMRGYCDFYEVDPRDEDLLALARILLEDPEKDGVQLIARDGEGDAAGFATIYWSFSTHRTGRIGVMNDLFVAPAARGQRVGERLIEACLERCRERGALALEWETALDNERAQALYDRIGGKRERWLSYSLETPRP
jgi:ribosomal protein S18 acetylase RimI-like enzyme